MKLYNYYTGSAESMVHDIDKFFKKNDIEDLSYVQCMAMREYLRTRKILYKVEEKKTHPLWRLTAPLFFLISLLFAISMPFKWIITGSYYYDFDDKPIRFMNKWKMKIMD